MTQPKANEPLNLEDFVGVGSSRCLLFTAVVKSKGTIPLRNKNAVTEIINVPRRRTVNYAENEYNETRFRQNGRMAPRGYCDGRDCSPLVIKWSFVVHSTCRKEYANSARCVCEIYVVVCLRSNRALRLSERISFIIRSFFMRRMVHFAKIFFGMWRKFMSDC